MFEVLEGLWYLVSAIIEASIVLLFCKINGKNNSIRPIMDSVIFGVFMFLIHQIGLPFGRQLIYVIFTILYCFIVRKINLLKSIKIVFFSMIFMLVLETLYCIPLDVLFKLDLSVMSRSIKLFILVPVRLLQYIILYKYWRYKYGNALVGRNPRIRRRS